MPKRKNTSITEREITVFERALESGDESESSKSSMSRKRVSNSYLEERLDIITLEQDHLKATNEVLRKEVEQLNVTILENQIAIRELVGINKSLVDDLARTKQLISSIKDVVGVYRQLVPHLEVLAASSGAARNIIQDPVSSYLEAQQPPQPLPVFRANSIESADDLSSVTHSVRNVGRLTEVPSIFQKDGLKNVQLKDVFFSWYDERIYALNGAQFFSAPKSYKVNEHVKKFARIIFYMKLFLPPTVITAKPGRSTDVAAWQEQIRSLAATAAEKVHIFRGTLITRDNSTMGFNRPKHTSNVLAMERYLNHVHSSLFPRVDVSHIVDEATSKGYNYSLLSDVLPGCILNERRAELRGQ